MRYLVLKYEYNTSAEAENRVLSGFDTENEAIAQFHSTLYQDMSNENISKSLVMVIDETGGVIKSERYDLVVEEEEESTTDDTTTDDTTEEDTTTEG